MSNFIFVSAIFFVIFIGFHAPDIKNFRLFLQLIWRKLIIAILIGAFIPIDYAVSERAEASAFSVMFIFLYSFWTLAKDCPKGHAEDAVPLLKFSFVWASFFTTFGIKQEELLSTIVTICMLLGICIVTLFVCRQMSLDHKSSYIEIVCLCIEHLLALVATYFIANSSIERVFVMAVIEELIITTTNFFLFYLIKRLYNEDTSDYFKEKRLEILG